MEYKSTKYKTNLKQSCQVKTVRNVATINFFKAELIKHCQALIDFNTINLKLNLKSKLTSGNLLNVTKDGAKSVLYLKLNIIINA